MNENAIKNYATWARRELMSEVERRCALYGISGEKDCPNDAESVGGWVLSSEERRMRRELVGEAKRGMQALVERAACTWFNRMLAIRFMECNDRLPSQTRMFSAPDGTFAPQALKEALSVEIENVDRTRASKLVQDGDDEKLFRYLFLLQCDELADCMPAVFDKIGKDPLILLLPDGLLRPDSVIGKLVIDIAEDDWREGVQIVGWMYQFYISEKKDEFFASKRKATAEDIPAATQLFTPEWIVQYLVQNSLGRLWMLNRPGSRLAEKMDYFIAPDPDAHEEFQIVSSPEEITLIDPACGSGHILVYAFDLLAAIYEECGYSRRDIPRLILEMNLTGVEIDRRAGALASFALTMKACEYDSRFLRRGVCPMITILEKIEFGQEHIDVINAARRAIERKGAPFLLEQVDLLDALAHLNEVGSLFLPTDEDMEALHAASEALAERQELFADNAIELMGIALAELEPLHAHYSICTANPPYLGSGMASWLAQWVKAYYPDEKNDLCTCFISRVLKFITDRGFAGLVTMESWLFISTFERLRKKIIEHHHIVTLAHVFDGRKHADNFSANAMLVMQNCSTSLRGVYFRLSQMGNKAKADSLRFSIANPEEGELYQFGEEDFKNIPGWPLNTFWLPKRAMAAFNDTTRLQHVAPIAASGHKTGNNDLYIRYWFEVDCRNKRWHLVSKGGEWRKWYGNLLNVIDWSAEAKAFYTKNKTSNLMNEELCFHAGITWSDISSKGFTCRYLPDIATCETVGPSLLISDTSIRNYVMGLLNSSFAELLFKVLNPGLHYKFADVYRVPCLIDDKHADDTVDTVNCCIQLAQADYDAFEISRDFTTHPIIDWSRELRDITSIGATMQHFYGYHPEVGSPLELCYMLWQGQCRERFDRLKSNEEELNRIFARIYNMEGEVSIEVPEDKVSVRLADKVRDIKSLVSYAVGCMLGRYSLDVNGLVLANQGDGLVDYLAKVPEPAFMPDDDGIIPITDVEYFHDDATGFFVDFVRTVYGEGSLEENLAFVADALGGGGTPREVIREYFMNGFFADHCKIYQKRPIYWLFDSGKKGGFRALVYMHRYKPDLLAKLRTDYVHEQQDRYRTQIEHIDDAIETADRKQQADLKKRRKKLAEQLAEISVFEEKVHHLADQMIEIDLDDGVKVNYAKFQDVLSKIK